MFILYEGTKIINVDGEWLEEFEAQVGLQQWSVSLSPFLFAVVVDAVRELARRCVKRDAVC